MKDQSETEKGCCYDLLLQGAPWSKVSAHMFMEEGLCSGKSGRASRCPGPTLGTNSHWLNHPALCQLFVHGVF